MNPCSAKGGTARLSRAFAELTAWGSSSKKSTERSRRAFARPCGRSAPRFPCLIIGELRAGWNREWAGYDARFPRLRSCALCRGMRLFTASSSRGVQGNPCTFFFAKGMFSPWMKSHPSEPRLSRRWPIVFRAGCFSGDIRPANVLVDEQGRVSLVDFGLARFFDRSLAESAPFTYAADDVDGIVETLLFLLYSTVPGFRADRSGCPWFEELAISERQRSFLHDAFFRKESLDSFEEFGSRFAAAFPPMLLILLHRRMPESPKRRCVSGFPAEDFV